METMTNELTIIPQTIGMVTRMMDAVNIEDAVIVSEKEHPNFIESNTSGITLEELEKNCIVPSFSDNQLTISHQAFIHQVEDAARMYFTGENFGNTEIRVSHKILGRVPSALTKKKEELKPEDETVYYQRMAFCFHIRTMSRIMNGEEVHLCIGGVRSLNEENLYARKSPEKFKIFIGWRVRVCSNLMLTNDGLTGRLEVMSDADIYSSALRLFQDFNPEQNLRLLENLGRTMISQEQFCQIIGRLRLYQALPAYRLKELPKVILGDSNVNAVRKAGTKEEKEKLKMKLPAITWNGTFKTKNRNDLEVYSSFTALDFDDIEPEKMDGFGKWLQGFSCVYAYFITPKGQGYKAIILHDNYEPLYHYDLYKQLLKKFECGSINDKSTIDLARGHYLSYDPGLWKNPDPQPFHFVSSTPEPVIPDTVTETVIKDESGNDVITADDSSVAKFLNTLSRQVTSDDSIIRILGSIWTGESLANGRNNTAMSYAGVLCKAGVEKERAKSFIEELIPDFDITEIIEYAYSHNTFGCERRKYKSRKK